MSIPDYQTLMLPLLKAVNQRGCLAMNDATQLLSKEFKLTDAESRDRLPSGKQTVIQNRVGWARTYLKKAGLLDSPERGVIVLTERGKNVLSRCPEKIDIQYLRQFPEFLDFRDAAKPEIESNHNYDVSKNTPEEILEESYSQLKNAVLEELLNKIKSSTPEFFERLVVNTIVKMGYGGSLQDAGRAIGKSGDEGIDGIISEDRLGLDVIYLQAKKWEGTVGRPEIQKFAGALQGKRARKGVFITTSDFSSEAREYVKHLDAKIILINGQQLTQLMWENNVGLSRAATYEVKKIDGDYFGE
jgi:restriction system protein